MSRRWIAAAVVAAVILIGAVPGTFAARKAAGLRRLGTPIELVKATGPAPAPLPGRAPAPGATGDQAAGSAGLVPIRWTANADGRITDVAVLPARGLVIYVEEVAHRSWRATAVDARTGQVRWSNARGHTGHIEAWTVTDSAVVLAYHHSASRLAWRTHKAASLEGIDPVTGEVLWVRHIYNLIGDRPGDFAPTLASPAENIVYARTEFGIPNAIDARTGATLWEYPDLNDCHAHQVTAGPAGVAITQRCPEGKERLALVDPHTGLAVWKTDFSTPALRVVGVSTDSVAVYQGGLVKQLTLLGPGGGSVTQIPCDCGDGTGLDAGTAGGAVLAAGPAGRIGVGGTMVVGGPFGLIGVDGHTGNIRWQTPVAGGPVRRVFAQDDDIHAVTARAALLRVNPADGTLGIPVPGLPGTFGDEVTDEDFAGLVAPAGAYLLSGTARSFTFGGPIAGRG